MRQVGVVALAGFLALAGISGQARTHTQLAAASDRVEAAAAAYTQATRPLPIAQQRLADAAQASLAVARTAVAADQEAEEARSAAESAESLAARTAREVAALIAQRQAALRLAEAEREDTLTRYDPLQVESARIAAQLRILAHTGGQIVRPGARLPMPVVGWKSSDFGMRYDPFYKVWQLHAGVDLAAPGGAPIWAAAAGRVVQAGWDGGYGNYTCIYHGTYQGKAFTTCYAHQSRILVHVGQSVQQGQVIGRVGTTGASTGTHVHFEVRLNGEPVDPLPWLPACLC